ncbi:MAG: SGNH/GDSL hydrolase family protein [Fimbriimonadaceae bacterium]|nr:SGNH/GDSL hydrolase family protein [Fimbriimonadaceae bacterium]
MNALPWLLLLSGVQAAPYDLDPAVAAEFRARDGLPNVLARLRAGGTVKIAWFGGSITAANGWRPKTLAWFREQFPTAHVVELNAAISGTGSDYGACRIAGDVLAQQPDLIFLEHRVNGGGGFEKPSVEGVVRQVWRANPRIDVCLVYTIGQWMLPELRAGRQVGFGRVMEEIANAYGIPSIDLGVEVARREAAGSLIFKADAPVEGKLVFSKDGVHPGDEGHELYREVIARALASLPAGPPLEHRLPAPLTADCWETAALVPVAAVSRAGEWQPVDITTDAVYRNDYGRTHAMLRGAVKTTQLGATLTVRWTGTTVGLSDIPHGQPMVFQAVVDGGAPITLQRKQTEARQHARFVYLPAQPAGPHTVVFTLLELPAGQAWYAGQVLVVGTPAPPGG